MTDPGLVDALPCEWYFDDAIYRRERHAIFGREWLYAACVEELPKTGDTFTCTLAGTPLLLIRDADGQVRGHHNVCRHRGSPVVLEPCGNKPGALVCPYHGWSYSAKGKLLGAPMVDPLPDLSLAPVQVAVHRGLIFVNFAPEAPPFASALGGLTRAIEASRYPLERYRFHSTMAREGRFNWKTWVDGYQECYHCPTIHPGFKRDFQLARYRVDNHERFSVHSCERKEGASPSGGDEGLWLWVHPNLGMPCYAPCWYTLQVNPLSATRTRLTYTFRMREGEDAAAAAEFIAFVEQVTSEDIDICERVQQNLESGSIAAGLLNPRRENGVAYFQSLVRAALGG